MGKRNVSPGMQELRGAPQFPLLVFFLQSTSMETIPFLSDKGYVVINKKKEAVTVVPEKLRKKYRDYLEGK